MHTNKTSGSIFPSLMDSVQKELYLILSSFGLGFVRSYKFLSTYVVREIVT